MWSSDQAGAKKMSAVLLILSCMEWDNSLVNHWSPAQTGRADDAGLCLSQVFVVLSLTRTCSEGLWKSVSPHTVSLFLSRWEHWRCWCYCVLGSSANWTMPRVAARRADTFGCLLGSHVAVAARLSIFSFQFTGANLLCAAQDIGGAGCEFLIPKESWSALKMKN